MRPHFTENRTVATSWWQAVAAATALAGCQTGPASDPLTEPFPAGFIWGTATAGFQVDMGCPGAPCNDTASDWYQWVTTEPVIADGLALGQPLDDGPGHWELYETDFDLIRDELANNGYRMSIEWSRIFPESTAGVEAHADLLALADADAMRHYRDVFAALRARGIRPLVTLNHYTLPLWIHDGADCYLSFRDTLDVEDCDNRGWLDAARLIPELAKYAGFIAREFGDEVDLWATLNEPYAVILAGFAVPTPAERTNPPGIASADFKFATPVIRAMIEAHARMYDAVIAADTVDADGDGEAAEVGIVMNLAEALPREEGNPVDLRAVDNFNYFYNYLFLDALTQGSWDEDVDGTPDETRTDLAGRMDYVGINYYTSVKLIGIDGSFVEHAPVVNFIPGTGALFNFAPEGIYVVSMLVKERYDLPVYITEHGAADSFDPAGAEALVPHLAWLRRAIHDGADVRGFFYWSLMDNYEWNHGYELKFGLYGYDEVSKARQAKPLAAIYGDIARGNALAPELLAAYGGQNLPPPLE